MTVTALDLLTAAALSGFGLSLAALGLSVARRRRLRADLDGMARRLDTLAGRVSALESRGAETPGVPRPSPRAVPVTTPPPAQRVDRAGPSAGTGPTLIAVPDLSAMPPDPSTGGGPASELGRRYAALWEMAERGTPPESIARATGQPIGQVELILGLKRPRPTPGRPRGS